MRISQVTMPPFSDPPSPEHPFATKSDENHRPSNDIHFRPTDAPADIELSPKSVVIAPSAAQHLPSESTWARSLAQVRIYQHWKNLPSSHDVNDKPKSILKRQSIPGTTEKSVTFSNSPPNTRIISNVSMWNDPELACSVWYSKQQFRDMTERCELLLDLLHHGIVEPYNYESVDKEGNRNNSHGARSVIQNEDYCSIGFDSCFGQGREIAEALQIGGRAAVFLEQETQFRDGYCCEELIRSVYLEFSDRAEGIARQRGINMAKAAGDWVYQDLTREMIQWMYTQGNCKPLERLVVQQLSNSK